MKLELFAIICASVAMSAVAQLCLKLGVARVSTRETVPIVDTLITMFTSPFVLLGLTLYGAGAVVWLFVLSRAPLSLAYPFVGMGFILTAAISVVVLGEQANAGRVLGTLLIAIGCVVVARSA